ncbi:SBBP repeat-containing protein [Flavobacterium sp. HJ-32-4]|uniref:SBBP repeat-containing protein n=1 Tax=Flavobacterium sp. HJ-32-4 TaxID=1160795 RepID=UPI001F13FA2D|nr:SBBP repeat-containing protein [Flavobacterium sp. HJ-32-4]UMY65586.1 SBBP repeat-containing protein [Flavobacterium sp. HJ-32-4]
MKISLLFGMCLFCSLSLSAQVWVNRYNGQGDYSDRFTAVMTDASGNVYLAGSAIMPGNNQDIVLMKTDPSGNVVWKNIYDGPSSGADAALAMTMDTSGNIYVTGYGKFSASATDIVTIKYDSAGTLLWTANYGYITDQYEQGNSITVDTNGNVYVAGQSDPDATTNASDDYVVLKYNASGVQQWVQRTNGTGNGVDRPSKIALDASGNPVVTGRSDNLVNYDYLTVKYNASTGSPIWSVRFDRTHNDWATDLIINPTNGNIYVTGRSKNTDFDYATVCYNSSGVQQWATIYDNGIGDNRATNIGMDSSGNVYVTGQSDVGTASVNYDIVTLKYNSSGVQQWLKTYSGTALDDDIPTAFYVSPSGNVIIAGMTDTDAAANVSNNYVVQKYNGSGVLQWTQTYTNSASSNDIPRGVVEDASGNVIVTGASEVIPQRNAVTVKYNASGTLQWTNIENETGDNSDKPNAMAIDANGNMYVAGYVVEYGADRNFALQKITAAGATAWVRTLNGTAVGSSDSALGVAVDNAGNIYVAGYTHNKGTSSDITVAKYDTNGNQLWVSYYDYATETDRALGIALDGSNNVYVTGRSDSNSGNVVSNDDIVTIKYNTNGTQLWAARYNGSGNTTDTGRAIRVTTAGNVYVAGRTSNATNFDYIVLKYNTSGVQQWVNSYAGAGNDEIFFMELDGSENVYVTGNSQNSSLTSVDIVTQKITSAGVSQWTARYDGPATGTDLTDAIKIDTAGNVWVAGSTDTDTSDATLNSDICLIKYDSSGNQTWASTYGSGTGTDDQAVSLALDGSNNAYLCGMINGPTNYDYATFKFTPTGTASAPLVYNGPGDGADIPQTILFRNNFLYVTGSSTGTGTQSDFATLKYDPATLSVTTIAQGDERVKVYPNPASDQLNIDLSQLAERLTDNTSIILYDTFGRTVLETRITGVSTQLDVNSLAAGCYILAVRSGKTPVYTSKVVIR